MNNVKFRKVGTDEIVVVKICNKQRAERPFVPLFEKKRTNFTKPQLLTGHEANKIMFAKKFVRA